mmetsp:Transcript_28852/g.48032  ORF Transcript_28852/g.48032 Transcript_28852/m.48032 type:complete len:299 (-) Transcript_28852:254-1150(-)
MISEYLTSEILAGAVLPFVATPRDVTSAALVCQNFRAAADSQSLWRMVALTRYGPDIVAETERVAIPHVYCDWKDAILCDDNALVAHVRLPSSDLKVCRWGWNNRPLRLPSIFVGHQVLAYYCVIEEIRWSRYDNRFSFYLNVRGEMDLRRPESSAIFLIQEDGTKRQLHLSTSWHSELSSERPGHYKGRLDIDIDGSDLWSHGKFVFQYAANADDYIPVELFAIGRDHHPNLRSVFGLDQLKPEFANGNEYYCMSRSPEEERQLWESVVPARVLDRRRGERDAWWVESRDSSPVPTF